MMVKYGMSSMKMNLDLGGNSMRLKKIAKKLAKKSPKSQIRSQFKEPAAKRSKKVPENQPQFIFMLLNFLPEDVVGDVGVVGAERAHDDAALLAVVVELEEARHIVGHREEDCRVFNSPISNLNLRFGILICKLKCKLGFK